MERGLKFISAYVVTFEYGIVITGNEVMTYGTPPNLMDLVDLFGSTGTVQDWSVMSPVSPTVAELTTPAPSPSPTTVVKSGKRHKI